VLLPENLFESTGIPVTMYVLDRRPKDCAYLVDASTLGTKYIREQRGEGSRSHTERIYKKEMVRFTEQQVAAIQQMTEKEAGVSRRVTYAEMAEREYCMARGPYVPADIDESHTVHRAYPDIITDLNKINRLRNTLKVTVNKVWAEQLGLTALLDLSDQDKQLSKAINEQLASIGITDKIIEPDYIAQTNSKELKVVQVDKEILSPVFESFIPLWYQHLRTMNNLENMLMAELRDALLEESASLRNCQTLYSIGGDPLPYKACKHFKKKRNLLFFNSKYERKTLDRNGQAKAPERVEPPYH